MSLQRGQRSPPIRKTSSTATWIASALKASINSSSRSKITGTPLIQVAV